LHVLAYGKCRGCTDQLASTRKTTVDNDDSASVVDKFRYSGDMLRVDRDADAAVEVRARKGQNKFRQLVPPLINRDVSLLIR